MKQTTLNLQKQAQDNLSKAGKKGMANITNIGVSSAEEKPDPVHTDKVLAEKSGTSKASVYRVKKIMDEGTRTDLTSSSNELKVEYSQSRDQAARDLTSVQHCTEVPCPRCGKVCPNDVYCVNCGTMRLVRLEC